MLEEVFLTGFVETGIHFRLLPRMNTLATPLGYDQSYFSQSQTRSLRQLKIYYKPFHLHTMLESFPLLVRGEFSVTRGASTPDLLLKSSRLYLSCLVKFDVQVARLVDLETFQQMEAPALKHLRVLNANHAVDFNFWPKLLTFFQTSRPLLKQLDITIGASFSDVELIDVLSGMPGLKLLPLFRRGGDGDPLIAINFWRALSGRSFHLSTRTDQHPALCPSLEILHIRTSTATTDSHELHDIA